MDKAELEKTKDEIKTLESELKSNRALPLIKIISKKGKFKGELHHLTKAQYLKLMGRPARKSIIVKGVIPWHLALDELATERGYKSDEQLKEAIEKASEDKQKLEQLKSYKKELKTRVKTEVDKPEHVKSEGDFNVPVFPKNEKTKSDFKSLGDTETLSIRNPSFWQTEIDYKSTPKKPDLTYRVRYIQDAISLQNAAIKDERRRLTSSFKPQKVNKLRSTKKKRHRSRIIYG